MFVNVQERIFKKRRKITRKWQNGHENWKSLNKAGAGEASGQSQGSHGHKNPQSLRNCISNPVIKFEESSHLVPQLSKLTTLVLMKIFGRLTTQALQHSRNSQITLGIKFMKNGILGPHNFRLCIFGPLVWFYATTGSLNPIILPNTSPKATPLITTRSNP